MTGLALLIKRTARLALFGPRKRPMTFREKRDATTRRLKAELRADKLRAVQVELDCRRAVEAALECPPHEVALRGEAAE